MFTKDMVRRSLDARSLVTLRKLKELGLDNRNAAAIKLCTRDIRDGLRKPRTEVMTQHDRYHRLIPFWRSPISRRRHGLQHWEYLQWFDICLAAQDAGNQDLL